MMVARHARGIPVGVALLGIPVLALLSVTAEAGGQSLRLETVSNEDLAGVGITLTDPGRFETDVSASKAAEIASRALPSGPILEVTLAHVLDSAQTPPIDRAVWVVSHDPASQPGCLTCGSDWRDPFSRQDPGARFAITLVDPETGEVIVSKVVGNSFKLHESVTTGYEHE